MSLPAAPASKKKLPLLKIAIVLVVLGVAAVLVLRGFDLRALFDKFMSAIRTSGPAAFFTALAILPAFGFPVLAFSLTAAPAFRESLGMALVVGLVLIAVTINFLLAYALSRRALRPLLEKLIVHFGYKLPTVEAGDTTDLMMILRLTPGIPFFVQNYLSGLADVKFGKYLVVSCLIVWPMNVAAVLFSDAIVQGKGRLVITATTLLIAVIAATQLARKHYARKQKTAP